MKRILAGGLLLCLLLYCAGCGQTEDPSKETPVIGYSIDDTVGFPSKYKFANIKAGSIIVADTLIDNVVELHKFLYGDTDYTPSRNIQDASDKIMEIVGGADTLVDEAPVNEETDTTAEIVWQGDGSGNYNYTDYTDGDYSGGDYSGGDNSGGDNSGGDNSGGGNSGGDYSGGDDYDGDYSDGDNSGGDFSDGDNSDGDYSDGDTSGGDGSYEDSSDWEDSYSDGTEE